MKKKIGKRLKKTINKMKRQYAFNKEASVGDTCICPSCGSEFEKGTYQQAFCKTKPKTQCKDKYWNKVTDTKRDNRERISPASADWLFSHGYCSADLSRPTKPKEFDPHDEDHPFSDEALGQW